jgi:hypothetical protein
MKDFLVNESNAFKGVKWQNILKLLEVLGKSKLRTRQHIKRRYKEQATKFDATVTFLLSIDVLSEEEGKLVTRGFSEKLTTNTDEKETASHILDFILKQKNNYQNELFIYLRQFKVFNGEVLYKPIKIQRTRYSEVRNLLMEMGIISYDLHNDLYILASDYLILYVLAAEGAKNILPSRLRKVLENRENIGLAAEESVVVYEKKRVGPRYEVFVDHVSLRNAAAGYDIKSVTQKTEGKIIPRYIEVKAVSPLTFMFYWTSNEICVAELLGRNYYLYLLPVNKHLGFKFDELKIIQDPLSTIMNQESEWKVDENVVCCSIEPKIVGNKTLERSS